MTNERAVEILKKLIPQPRRGDGKSTTHLMITEALDIAIKALEQQPSENVEVIQVSKGALKSRQGRFVIYDVDWLKKNFYLEEKLYGQPKQPKRGKWIDYYKEMPIFNAGGFTETKHVGWTCSCCGENNVWIKSDYCPNCGSYNREEADE